MYLKIHNYPGQERVVAACDAELLNKTLTTPAFDIIIDPAFYGDTLATREEILKALKETRNANIIGKKVCELAILAGIIEKESCIMIDDIPHAQIYRI